MNADGICIYILLQIKNELKGKIVVLLAHLLILAIFIFAVIEGIVPLAIISLFIEGYLIKYTLWNLYGSETLIINTRTIAYHYNYGFFKTVPVTCIINKRLMLLSSSVDEELENRQLNVSLVSYNDLDLPVEIHQLSMAIPEADANKLSVYIEQIFLDKLSNDFSMPEINLN
jgi:hypothetical protein